MMTLFSLSCLPSLAAAGAPAPLTQSYLPVALMILVALGFSVGTIIFSGWFLPRFFRKIKPSNPTEVKLAPYECGIPATGDARGSVFVRFYLVALLFLLFDMETMYIVAWALLFRGALGSAQAVAFLLGEMGVFLAVLLVGYAFAWKKGALTWS